MKIGWITINFSNENLIQYLALNHHEIFLLSTYQSVQNFDNWQNFRWVQSIQEMVEKVDIIFTYFLNPADVYKIYVAQEGIINAINKANKKIVCIDLSNNSISLSKNVLSKQPLMEYVEAPLIVNFNQSKNPVNVLPIASKKYLFDKLQPIFLDLNVAFYYCGSYGSAIATKQANEILKASATLAVVEALNYAIDHNLDLDTLYNAIAFGAGGNKVFSKYFNEIKTNNLEKLNLELRDCALQVNEFLSSNNKNLNWIKMAKILYGIHKNDHNFKNELNLDSFLNLYPKVKAYIESNQETTQEEIFANDFEFTNNFNASFESSETNKDQILENPALSEQEITKASDLNLNSDFISDASPFIPNVDPLDFSQLNSSDKTPQVFEAKPVDLIAQTILSEKDVFIENEADQTNFENNDNESQFLEFEYQVPQSLNKEFISQQTSAFFEEKVDAEYGSLGKKEAPFETNDFISMLNLKEKKSKNNQLERADIESLLTQEYEASKDFQSSFLFKNDKDKTVDKKTLIFDLDGTILNSQHKVPQYTINTLTKANQMGHNIIIATGRCYAQTTDIIKQIGVVKYAILSNGAILFDVNKNEIVPLTKPLSSDVRLFFLKLAFERKISFLIYTELNLYIYCFSNQDWQTLSFYFSSDAADLSHMNYSQLESFLLDQNLNIFTISGLCDSLKENDWINIFKDLIDRGLCDMTSAADDCIDIYSGAVSKYSGYLELQKILNNKNDNTYFFGDSNNDYILMSHLKNGVALENASEKLKTVAKYQIGNNDSKAISNFVETVILNN
ncbi:MAG: Cof-type HAD-IIB family hydrolase [Malacoplasma sp.]|nr:Cof-type HAD-IIB family hydrolase [Malacoplasma sp.]